MIGSGIGGFADGMALGMRAREAFTGDRGPLGNLARGIGKPSGGEKSDEPQSQQLAFVDPAAGEMKFTPNAAVMKGRTDAPPSGFGGLSAKYESGGSSGTIAKDRTGGWSYGKYQFVGGGTTADGSSMRSFLSTLQQTDPEAYDQMEKAGGFDGARSGSKTFKQAWREVSSRPGFQEAEAQNARNTLFEPAAAMVMQRTGLDISQRSPALQEVLFSTAIQHGGSGSGALWRNALNGADPSTLSDKQIIDRLYDERSKVDVYFRSSDEKVQQSVASRFKRERADALRMLDGSSTLSDQAEQKDGRGLPSYTGKNPTRAPIWGLIQQFMTKTGA